MAFVLIDIVDTCKLESSKRPLLQHEALQVAGTLLQEVPIKIDENGGDEADVLASDLSNLQLAQTFYAANTFKEVDPGCISRLKHSKFYTAGLSATLRIVADIASKPSAEKRFEILDAALDVLEALLQSIQTAHVRTELDWKPQAWAPPVLDCLQALAIDVRYLSVQSLRQSH